MTRNFLLIGIIVFITFANQLDAQFLTVDNFSPEPNFNYADPGDNIIITFTQNVPASSLNDSTIIIRGSHSGRMTGQFSGAGTSVITFNPDNDFRHGELINVTITTRVISEVEQSLATGHTYSFTIQTSAAMQAPAVFAERIIGSSSGSARDVKALDYDRDGELDILISFEGFTEAITLYRNNSFSQFCTWGNVGEFRNVEVHDVDNDGDYDAFGSNGNGSLINVHDNNGEYPYPLRIATGRDPWTLTGGDLDSDGDIDLLAATLQIIPVSHHLYWFPNDGQGNFPVEQEDEIPSSFNGGSDSYFYIRDFNSDGFMDILAFQQDGQNIVWYENDSQQNFTEHFIINMNERQRLASGDLDDDSDIDLVAVSSGNSPDTAIVWLENNGEENFSLHVINSSTTARLYSVAITDIDGDQDQDILAGGYWFENDGNENFTEHIIGEGLGAGNNYYSQGINYADIDGDGDMDILVAGLSVLSWYENTAIMEVVTHTPVNSALNVPAGSDISISFDQPVDIATTNSDNIKVFSKKLGLIEGTVSGGGTNTVTFSPAENLIAGDLIEVSITDKLKSTSGHSLPGGYGFSFHVQTPSVPQPEFIAHTIKIHSDNMSGLDMADIDGDGDPDLVSSSWSELYWHENDGAGNFTSDSISISGTPVSASAFDQNGDGYMDIWVDNSSGVSKVYLNDGNRNFTDSENINVNIRLKRPMDLNHDGVTDMLYLTRLDNYVRWFIQKCNGFASFGSIPNTSAYNVAAADMDNDGDTDFMATTFASPVFLQNNSFTFSSQNLDSDFRTTSVYLYDLDNDGDADPVFTTPFNLIVWYENRLTADSMDFSQRHVIDTLNQWASDIIVVDLDGDSDGEIIVLSRNDGKLVWFENRLNDIQADFGSRQEMATGTSQPIKIMAADLDSDGDIDLAVMSEGDERLTWFENTAIVSGIRPNNDVLPMVYQLHQNYPNPFNPSTVISYQLAKSSRVSLKIYDMAGRELKTLVNKTQNPGNHIVTFDASGFASGIYIYKLKAGSFEQSKKMVLLR
jgi:hypothetical protein